MSMRLFFLLVKGGIMLLNSKGFTLVEVILASSMIMVIIMTIVPMGSLLEREKAVLSERRILSLKLHDELQPFLWNDQPLPARYSSKFNFIDVHFHFTFDGEDRKSTRLNSSHV